ncbi:hypothetical protein PYCCODRAFT_1431807 [Trametes coccinea BRFM310]|uniref:Uncharacterized protein n=1 Tax=Trametes coccinea (strain BRFM310) TaxID=1353009 RepID=A0A1Y2IXZ0_TRAC3|nr:hypothetical protein PYCCODRAFT_1431807 [Trametes coccinea BRFM310]
MRQNGPKSCCDKAIADGLTVRQYLPETRIGKQEWSRVHERETYREGPTEGEGLKMGHDAGSREHMHTVISSPGYETYRDDLSGGPRVDFVMKARCMDRPPWRDLARRRLRTGCCTSILPADCASAKASCTGPDRSKQSTRWSQLTLDVHGALSALVRAGSRFARRTRRTFPVMALKRIYDILCVRAGKIRARSGVGRTAIFDVLAVPKGAKRELIGTGLRHAQIHGFA